MSSAPLQITVHRDGDLVWQGYAPADSLSDLVAVVRGEVLLNPKPEATQVESDGSPLALAGLTPRELEVLTLIANGCSNRQIVDATHLSINSVKSYVRSAYRKIGVSSRPRAILWGIAQGLNPASTSRGEEVESTS